jgi:hypothetical protein
MRVYSTPGAHISGPANCKSFQLLCMFLNMFILKASTRVLYMNRALISLDYGCEFDRFSSFSGCVTILNPFLFFSGTVYF